MKKELIKKEKRNEDLIGGLILITIGLVFLLSNIFGFNFWSLLSNYWPVILIVIGLSIIIKNKTK